MLKTICFLMISLFFGMTAYAEQAVQIQKREDVSYEMYRIELPKEGAFRVTLEKELEQGVAVDFDTTIIPSVEFERPTYVFRGRFFALATGPAGREVISRSLDFPVNEQIFNVLIPAGWTVKVKVLE